MAKKGSSQGNIALIAIAIVVGALSAIPREVWVGLLILAFAYFILRALAILRTFSDSDRKKDASSCFIQVETGAFPIFQHRPRQADVLGRDGDGSSPVAASLQQISSPAAVAILLVT